MEYVIIGGEQLRHGVTQLGLALYVISLLGALVSGLIVALRNRRHRNAVLLTSAESLLGAGYWNGSLQQNFIFGIIYYLVAVRGFTIAGILFTRVPKNLHYRRVGFRSVRTGLKPPYPKQVRVN